MLMQNSSAHLDRLHAIRALGVQIAIDDFGTGYSSLAYLERFPVTHIKIDRSFVTPLDDPTRGSGVVRAVVEIGRALGLTTVAEGIETHTELQRLRELGCDLGQGYLFARPLEADAMANLVAQKTGPVFAGEVGVADRQGTVGTKRSNRPRSGPPAAAVSGTRAGAAGRDEFAPRARLDSDAFSARRAIADARVAAVPRES
jgi:hypothetical protein